MGAVSVVLGAFREAADEAPDLPALAGRLEHALDREGQLRQGEEQLESFTTALLGEISVDAGTLTLLNRGHPSPYLLEGGAVRSLDASEPDLPLGMGTLHASRSGTDTYAFAPGAVLLLVTDGVTEARNSADEFYDPVRQLAGKGQWAHPAMTIDLLFGDVEQWTGGDLDDDMAVLAILCRPEGIPCDDQAAVSSR